MLEWVCPSCDRLVDPALDSCPFCASQAQESPSISTGPVQSDAWRIADRLLRIALGTITIVTLIYFLIVVWAVYREDDLLLDRLTRWLPIP